MLKLLKELKNSYSEILMPLSVIKNTSKKIENEPFRHIKLENFFKENFYSQVCEAFQKLKSRGLSPHRCNERLSHMGKYDCYSLENLEKYRYPLDFFTSNAWKGYFSQLFDIPLTTGQVTSIHHHLVGSKTGWNHTDFNVVNMFDPSKQNNINSKYNNEITYFAIKGKKYPDYIRQAIRSIAVIFYFNNDDWHFGDGGETALYKGANPLNPVKLIPPRSNCIFAYEVSPNSYHRFIKNQVSERNSIICWYHSEIKTKLQRFPNSLPRYSNEI
ncbi:MAG: 2OG-Fe(II) oxygenase [Francisellaceae bacterium]|jgi:hypothetical protein|nr:2OG-Fe(II) oxygenase [Francisellaceae bacterium]MBT6206915.1 2OG-Fe(II) oxygenase [Francisellaceae bacterium]MBT6539167.1 2OG-Fe(II) oxygenase [Francisellaceae bacterium]